MKAKEIAMVIGIAILTSFFFGLFVDALYEKPDYQDFCPDRKEFPRPYSADCKSLVIRSEQTEIDKCYQEGGFSEFNYDEKGCETGFKECNFCDKKFQDTQAKYNRNVFFIIAPIGVVLLITGLFLMYEVIGTGLMFSGILLIAYATMVYSSDMTKWLRVLVVFIELVLLILVSVRKLKK
ncbi:hypothetical protein J4449_03640 [Candidatus Woesearchaeota archaeon]|nr:hypothetical protein [Candidatus Woesearchaeota archaeon]